jgi:hypothetical protein
LAPPTPEEQLDLVDVFGLAGRTTVTA